MYLINPISLVKAAEIPASNLGNIPVPYRGRVLPVAGDRTFDPWTVTIINDTDFHNQRCNGKME